MHMTASLVAVAGELMSRPDEAHWGYELSRNARVRAGTMYPILQRLLERGWLSDGWEDPEKASKRPPRRYYRLTETGMRELGAVLARAQQDVRFAPAGTSGRRHARPGVALPMIGGLR